MDDDLPDSWREALNNKKTPPRPPIQPPFRAWHGLFAAALPVLAAYMAACVSLAFKLDFPNWPAGIFFYAILMLGNGALISVAISDGGHGAFAARSAIVGIAAFCVAAIPYFAEIYFVFLATYVVTRLIGRLRYFGVMFLGLVSLAAILLAVPLALFFARTASNALLTDSTYLALAMIAAYPLAHSQRTAALPAEPNFFGRLDALSSGISSALLGLFSGLVIYRTVLLALHLAAWSSALKLNTLTEFAAACCGLAAGNCMCIWLLFKTAYIARAEPTPRKRAEFVARSLKDPRTQSPPPPLTPIPSYSRTHPDDQDTAIDDAT